MQFKMNKKEKEKGFTLVELLLVLAIISILSGTILVSVSAHKQKAYESRMLSQLAGAIQNMVLCRSDQGTINEPTTSIGGGNICSLGVNYGTWPDISKNGFTDVYKSTDDAFEDGGWHVYVDNGTSRICCNSGSNQCHSLVTGAVCTNTTP